jgi:hypothetical protein
MTMKSRLYLSVAAVALAAVLSAPAQVNAQQPNAAIHVGANDLGGVVTGPNGPEAGVWVIAETTDLGTKMSKMVVTDDQGRYVLPDLPKASYNVWVRGYGLVDSPKVKSEPGKMLNLTAVKAPNEAAAAQYYPAIYWWAMMKIPDKSQFPGTGPAGNGLSPNMKTQGEFLDMVRTDGCATCHQLGNKATREIPASLGTFANGFEAWTRRVQSGQAATNMVNNLDRMGTSATLRMFGDWTDRIAKGELPSSKPERPQGVERNVVVTVYDWATTSTYLHDSISTDRRNPTINANGPLYGSTENSTDELPVLDPAHNTITRVKIPVRDPKTPSTKDDPMLAPSPYNGDTPLWDSQAVVHNPMYDEQGNVWFTARIRPAANPNFCKQGSDLESAKLFPLATSGRQLAMLDRKTGQFTLINTCFPTHHLEFGYDKNDTLWTSAGGPAANVVGWLNTKMFRETGDEQKSQGWTALIVDTNGKGKREGEYTEPNQPIDPNKQHRINAAFYGVSPSPADNSVWGSSLGYPGSMVRLDPGANPPDTALAEIYNVPAPGYGPRVMNIDSQGVVWTPLASGHFASFDRRKCKVVTGPIAGTGNGCPEGWTLYPFPGPQFSNLTDSGSAEAAYGGWVDQHDTLGLGKDVPIATGNENEGMLALVNGKWVTLRVPYPMGFYAKGMDGRIDDPKGGWKGRGIWTTAGNRTPFHVEGGKGNLPKVYHFQMRPDPLAD